MDNKSIAEEILKNIGGKENVKSVAHCATRLRIIVVDKDKLNNDGVENIDKVKGCFFNSGQFQIILGTGLVDKVYAEFIKIVGEENKISLKEAKASGNKFQRAIRIFGDIFVPIIPVLVATGLFMGLRGLIVQEQVLAILGLTSSDVPASFITFTQILTDTAFAFLPALVCWSTFKTFGGNPVIGIVIGLMLVSNNLPNAYDVASGSAEPLKYFGFINVVGYQGSVLPAFITGILGANFDKLLRKYIPDVLNLILVPFLTLLVSVTLALFIIGPMFHSVENYILIIVEKILTLPLGIGGLLYGCFGQLLGILGIHHVLSLLEINMLASTGWNLLNPIGSCGNIAQAGAVLAVAMKYKSVKMKQLAYPSSLSALLGITEPAVFGVTLRLVKPFIMSMIAGGIGGCLASILGLKANGMSLTGIPGILLYLNNQLPLYILVSVITFVIAFGLTYMFGVNEKSIDKENTK